MNRIALVALACVMSIGSLAHADPADAKKPVKVFILAGQSNMEGKAKVSLLETQLKVPANQALFGHLRKDGKWVERDDVWVKFLNRKGNLTVGFGSENCIGPELGIGEVVGDRYSEQVLLIKTAWGGRSLYRDFRPPSAGLPADAVLEKMLEQAKANAAKSKANPPPPVPTMGDVKAPFGKSYREMMTEVTATLADLNGAFPGYAGQGYELAGFVWFQGWNDMINADYTAEYAANMAHFIRDVRRDLKSPNLPFVIGQMGVDGVDAKGNVVKFKEAQAAAAALPEFKGNVALVRLDVYWDKEADAVFKKGWRQNLAEWNQVGSDFPYHYLGSVKTMYAMGRAMGEAAVELRGEKRPSSGGGSKD